jgi:phosphatidylserine/phosphatidylglycerophosphate/cardiolipin synthase-like enzyme
VSQGAAQAIVAQRAGADGIRGTADDGEVYTLAELTSLGATRGDLSKLARAAATTAPVDEACSASTARSLTSELVVTPDQGDARVLSLIAGAQRTIEVVMYELSATSVRAALAAASARGVKVRVILDRTRPRTPAMLAALHAAGIAAQASPSHFTFTHQKTMVVDGAKVLVFSGNFDRASFATGRNFGIVLRDPEDVWDVQELFEADWTGRAPDVSCTRLVVSPVNSGERIVALVDGATTTLAIEALYASDPAVLDAIVRAKARGVAVRVLFNDPAFGVGDASDEANLLAGHGIPVRRSPSLFIHAKLVLADRARAFVGSENFSTTSLGRNREVGVVVSASDVDVATIAAVFDHDFAAGVAFVTAAR